MSQLNQLIPAPEVCIDKPGLDQCREFGAGLRGGPAERLLIGYTDRVSEPGRFVTLRDIEH